MGERHFDGVVRMWRKPRTGLRSLFVLVDKEWLRFLSQRSAGLRAGLPVWCGLEKVSLEVGRTTRELGQ